VQIPKQEETEELSSGLRLCVEPKYSQHKVTIKFRHSTDDIEVLWWGKGAKKTFSCFLEVLTERCKPTGGKGIRDKVTISFSLWVSHGKVTGLQNFQIFDIPPLHP